MAGEAFEAAGLPPGNESNAASRPRCPEKPSCPLYAEGIVDHDPMAVAQRTQDTMRYIQSEWNKSHEELMDAAELHQFLCDEHYGDLTEEQKAFARLHRDEMRNVYGASVCRLLLCEEMLHRNMVADLQTYRSVFCPERDGALRMLDRAE